MRERLAKAARHRIQGLGRIGLMLAMALGLAMPSVLVPSQMAGAAMPSSVSLDSDARVRYGGWDTARLSATVGSGSVEAYCLEPSKETPPTGTYASVAMSASDAKNKEVLAKTLWYGYGGPGFDARMWPETYYDGTNLRANPDALYALTHILAADVYASDGNKALAGTVQSFRDWSHTYLLGFENPNRCIQDRIIQELYWDDTRVATDKRMPADFADHCFLLYTGSGNQTIGSYLPGGYIDLQKVSSNATITDGNGCYSLQGAAYGIYRDAGCTDLVETMATNGGGYAKSGYLTRGTYYVKETASPRGYLTDGTAYPVTVANGRTVRVNTSTVRDTPTNDPIFIDVSKYDRECDWEVPNHPLGGATLEGAEYTVEYYDGDYSTVDSAMVNDPVRTWVFSTDAEGIIDLGDAASFLLSGQLYEHDGHVTFPLGTYVIYETKAPDGYLLSDNKHLARIVQEGDGTKVLGDAFVHGENFYIGDSEQVKRGDIELLKVREDDMARLPSIPFSLTSETTGESHILVTDENGYASTASSWNPHSVATNANDDVEDGGYDLESGVWFGLRHDGSMTPPIDSKGALPYDLYTLEELPCDGNEGLELARIEHITVKRDAVTVDLGTVDDRTTPIPYIHTTASDARTGLSYAMGDDKARINDHVEYANLRPGSRYNLAASLVYADDGSEVAGAHGELTFTPELANGYANVEIPVDLSIASGRSVVVFERLYLDEELVASHEDISDNEQMITVVMPAIGTVAKDAADGDSEIMPAPGATVIDNISYTGLVVGEEYVMSGTLMVRGASDEEGSAEFPLLDAAGEPVSSSTVFTPRTPSGTIQVTFVFDASGLEDGTTLVAYETCTKRGKVVASHEDIGDEAQSVIVRIPSIGTVATDGVTGSKEVYATGDALISDEVSYSGLVAGRQYEMRCTLMVVPEGSDPYSDAWPYADGEGQTVESVVSFVPEDTYGSVDVPFPLDASQLLGSEVVCYEELWSDGSLLVSDKSIDNADETVLVTEPGIGTQAVDATDGDHQLLPSSSARIDDIVSYEHLVPSEEYTVRGWLMDKADGRMLYVGDSPVEGSTTFVPNTPAGEVVVTFSFDASSIGSASSLVAFEELVHDGEVIAEHKDISDASQTVTVERSPKGSGYAKTGGSFGMLVVLAASAAIALAVMVTRLVRRRS